MADPPPGLMPDQYPATGSIGPIPSQGPGHDVLGAYGNLLSQIGEKTQQFTDPLTNDPNAPVGSYMLGKGLDYFVGGPARASGQAYTDWSQGFAPMDFSESLTNPTVNREQLYGIARGIPPVGIASRLPGAAAKALRGGGEMAQAEKALAPQMGASQAVTRQHAEHVLTCDECEKRAEELVKQGMTPGEAARRSFNEHFEGAGGERAPSAEAPDDRPMGTPWPGTDTGAKLSDIEEPGPPGTSMAPRKTRGDSPRDYWIREGMGYEKKAQQLLTQYKMSGERRFYDEASRYYLMAKAIRDKWRDPNAR